MPPRLHAGIALPSIQLLALTIETLDLCMKGSTYSGVLAVVIVLISNTDSYLSTPLQKETENSAERRTMTIIKTNSNTYNNDSEIQTLALQTIVHST